MKEYACGEWSAELIGSRIVDIPCRGAGGHAKVRRFAVKKGKGGRFFCVVSVLDSDGTHEDTELQQILSALAAFGG